MEISPKQIIPYLAYGLNIKILNHKCDYVGIKYAKANGFYFIGESIHLTYEGGSTGKDINNFKILLKPMSKFTKKLYNQVKEQYPNTQNFDYCYRLGLSKYPNLAFTSIIEWCVIHWMIERNFDVFGLIKNGLAIDINSVPELLNT